ncbi:hypothetical protein TRIUR3_32134 [Triticum urartu]|uniref:Uncharacterized protein n=1 Tax=Triticum urartu TaxID=4572 RepID=M7YB62_TRIUA|nr:hypothetical protein TRIUR3_32134 [Triticum urartu]
MWRPTAVDPTVQECPSSTLASTPAAAPMTTSTSTLMKLAARVPRTPVCLVQPPHLLGEHHGARKVSARGAALLVVREKLAPIFGGGGVVRSLDLLMH